MRFDEELPTVLALVVTAIAIRSVPEMLSYPYLIGHDTIFYAGVLQRVGSCVDILSYFPSPLLPLILCPLGKVFGSVTVMEIYPPVAYGMLAAPLYVFARESLRMNRFASIISTLLLLLQFGMLRIGWDLHRNILALASLLLLLSQIQHPTRGRQLLLIGGLAALVILTHELTSLLMVGILVILAIVALLKGERGRPWHAVPVALASVSILCYMVFLQWHFVSGLFATYVWHDVMKSLPEFFVLRFLPLLPFAFLARKVNRVQLAWILVTATTSLSAILLPYGFAFWDRWMLMMVPPLGFLAASGMLRVASLGAQLPKGIMGVSARGAVVNRIVPVFLLMLCFVPSVYLASGFMSYPSNQPFWYFDNPALWRGGWSGIPATMVSNTLPLRDVPDVIQVISQLNAIVGPNDAVLAHEAFYGWLLLHLDHDIRIIPFDHDRVQSAITSARAQGFEKIYLLWFIPNSGWHAPDPDLSIFSEKFRSGIIVAYVYPQEVEHIYVDGVILEIGKEGKAPGMWRIDSLREPCSLGQRETYDLTRVYPCDRLYHGEPEQIQSETYLKRWFPDSKYCNTKVDW